MGSSCGRGLACAGSLAARTVDVVVKIRAFVELAAGAGGAAR